MRRKSVIAPVCAFVVTVLCASASSAPAQVEPCLGGTAESLPESARLLDSTPDIWEEDDTCPASATSVRSGDTQPHNFWDDPGDWVSFNACNGRSYILETLNLGANADTVLELYGTDCSTLLASDDDGGGGEASRVSWTATSDGTLHAKVLQKDGTSGLGRTYDLRLTGDTAVCGQWVRAFGGTGDEDFVSLHVTSDGGAVTAGFTASFGTVGRDIWVVKLDPSGNMEWQRSYGTSNRDEPYNIFQTSDGGYILAGFTFVGATYDNWIIRLDSSGAILWQRRIGTTYNDGMTFIRQTPDGGFVFSGFSQPSDSNVYIVKLDSSGDISWQRSYGNSSYQYSSTIDNTADGGFIVAAQVSLSGQYDLWVLKLDSAGNITWQSTYGDTTGDEYSAFVRQAKDGGYILTARTKSFGATGFDVWVLKLNPSGGITWQERFGGSGEDMGTSVYETPTGDFVVGASTRSFGAGGADLWILKLDSAGALLWNKTYGGISDEDRGIAYPLADGGIVLGGWTASFGPNASSGTRNVWVLRTDPLGGVGGACPAVSSPTVSAITTNDVAAPASDPVGTSSMALTVTSVSAPSTSGTSTSQCEQVAPEEVSPVGAEQPLVFSSETTLLWEGKTLSGSDVFNVYRGDLASLATGNYGSCLLSGLTASTAADGTTPMAGACWFYLVTGENSVGEGSMGRKSSGEERTNSNPC